MYERFTDRARKVLVLANQEAQRFNHEYVGTEHLLLGLVKEGDGVACEYIKAKGIDLRKVRLEVEKIVQSGPPSEVRLSKLPQTPRTKKVIEYAMEVSREFRHNYVGTDHLIIGMLREKEGVAATILTQAGITEEEATSTIFASSNLNDILRLAGVDHPGAERVEETLKTSQDAEDKCKSKLHQVAHVLVRYFFGAHSAALALQKLSEIVNGE